MSWLSLSWADLGSISCANTRAAERGEEVLFAKEVFSKLLLQQWAKSLAKQLFECPSPLLKGTCFALSNHCFQREHYSSFRTISFNQLALFFQMRHPMSGLEKPDVCLYCEWQRKDFASPAEPRVDENWLACRSVVACCCCCCCVRFALFLRWTSIIGICE